jgi:hypothetical protein
VAVAADAAAPDEARRAALLAALEAFDFDDDGDAAPAEWSFAQRLAHDNRWPAGFTARVLREYKRFVALTCLAGHPVCPSEQVDQAWHLHLLYTRSYWKRLCGEVLGRELHHVPTRGGAAQVQTHREMYRRTLAAYREVFGEPPPPDVWPAAEVRFGADVRVVRVRLADTWLLDKRAVWRSLLLAFALTLAAVLGAASV